MQHRSHGQDGLMERLRDLVSHDRDVEAAQLAAEAAANPQMEAALTPLLLEMARLSPQPAARVIAGTALARLRPGFAQTWRQVADIARTAGDHRTAADALETAAETAQGSTRDRLEAALSAYQDNDLERAERLYLALGEGPEAACGLAVIAIARGATAQAADILRRVLAVDPDLVEALRLMAMVAPDLATVQRLTRIANDERSPSPVRSAAAFALAQASDRAEDDITAAAWASLANSLSPARALLYDRAAQEARADALLDLFDLLPPPGAPLLGRPRPVVIVGLPRSGTSLIETLLGAHPDVMAGGERTDLYLACREIEIVLYRKGPTAAAALFAQRRAGLVRELSDRLSRAGLVSEVYLDKLPLNTPYAGLIARLLPEAKIVFVRRDPVETALSIWLHDFSAAYPYATDLEHLAHAVGLNDRMRAAWRERLGEQFQEVDHDALCADPQTEGRKLFEFCELDWDARYLEPERRSASVNTFSAMQVREPIRPRASRADRYPPEAAIFVEALKRA
jgi:tetratricopeptide (TPR) repeat protein